MKRFYYFGAILKSCTRKNRGHMKPRISMITLGFITLRNQSNFTRLDWAFPHGIAARSCFLHAQRELAGAVWPSPLAEDATFRLKERDSKGHAFHNVASKKKWKPSCARRLSGATLAKAAQKTDWGGYAGYFKDPDGHLWEIAHNPHFWVGPATRRP